MLDDRDRRNLRSGSRFQLREPLSTSARAALQQAALSVVSPFVLIEIEHITTRNLDRFDWDRLDEFDDDWDPEEIENCNLRVVHPGIETFLV